MSFTTLPLSNEKLTVAKFQALINELRPIRAQKTTDGTAFPSTTVLANETGMSVAVVAGVTYDFDAVVVYDAGAVADLKLAWTFPTASFYYTAIRYDTGSIASQIVSGAEASGTAKSIGGQGIGTFAAVTYTGFLVVTVSGTLQLQRAQNVSTAENTKIKAGSWVRISQAS